MAKADSEPIVLANWGRRFIAWLIDYFFINIMLAYAGLENFETRVIPAYILQPLPGFNISIWSPLSILILFLYWTLSEWYFGRSIGQLLLNLRLTDPKGNGVSLAASAIQSIGKSISFPVLPVDCLIGWTYPPCRKARQRFFNKLSNTIVIYLGKPMHTVKQGKYEKES
jgi:uncharacterized RDD family membrane protein YckC